MSLLVGALVTCVGDLMWGLGATLLVMAASVIALWVHRRRRLVASYHEQRRRARS